MFFLNCHPCLNIAIGRPVFLKYRTSQGWIRTLLQQSTNENRRFIPGLISSPPHMLETNFLSYFPRTKSYSIMLSLSHNTFYLLFDNMFSPYQWLPLVKLNIKLIFPVLLVCQKIHLLIIITYSRFQITFSHFPLSLR